MGIATTPVSITKGEKPTLMNGYVWPYLHRLAIPYHAGVSSASLIVLSSVLSNFINSGEARFTMALFIPEKVWSWLCILGDNLAEVLQSVMIFVHSWHDVQSSMGALTNCLPQPNLQSSHKISPCCLLLSCGPSIAWPFLAAILQSGVFVATGILCFCFFSKAPVGCSVFLVSTKHLCP